MNLKRVGSAAAVTLFLAACQDASLPTGAEPGSPAMLFSDGRDALTGDPDFFWLPPMLPNPSGEPNFEADQFDSGLLSQSRVRICQEAVPPIPQFSEDGTCLGLEVAEFASDMDFDGEFLRQVAGEEHYQADWHTDMSNLNDGLTYRIFALISGNVAGFADLDVVNSGKDLKSVATGEFVALKDGRTLPIKFRLEAGIRCLGLGLAPDDCGAGVVNPDAGGTVSFGAPDGSAGDGTTTAGVDVGPLAPHDGSHTDDVVFVVQSCLAATDSTNLVVDIPTIGPCIDVTAFDEDGNQIFALPVDPGTGFPQPVIIFACVQDADVAGLAAGQDALLRMHRQDGVGGTVEALPLADDPCEFVDLASSPTNSIVRFARAVLDRVVGFIRPEPLHARRRRIDLRSGGVTGFFSQFQLALPTKMEVLEGDGQTAGVGRPVPIPPAVLATDAHNNPVEGVRVTFDVTAGVGSVGSTQAIVFSDVDGETRVASWTMGPDPATNTLKASCIGCAVVGNDGPQVGIFDPFSPLPFTPSPTGPLPGETDVGPEVLLQTGELVFTATGELNLVVYGEARGATTAGADGGSFVIKAQNAGFTVTVFSASQWTTANTATFASFNVIGVPTIFLGQATLVVTDLATSNVAWGPAISGNIVLSGLHADEHTDAGATQLLENALAFAKSDSGTGFVSLVDCSGTPYSWVPSTGPFVGLSALDCVGADNITITDGTHPVMAGLISADLSNWGQSLHTFFPSVGGFTTITTGEGGPFSPVPPPGSPVVLVFPQPPPPVLYGVNTSDDGLSTIDVASGNVTFVGDLSSVAGEFTTPGAMAVRSIDNTIFVWNNSGTTTAQVLATVDVCTGLATTVGTTGQGIKGALAFGSVNVLGADSLFGFNASGTDSLIFIDPVSGAKTGGFPLSPPKRIFGADFDASGTLYGVTSLDGLVTIATTGVVTTVGTLDVDIGTPGSIVFASDGTLIGSGFGGGLGNIIFDIDPLNGTVSNIRSVTPAFAPQGMGFAAACSL